MQFFFKCHFAQQIEEVELEQKVETETANAVFFRCHFAQQIEEEELEQKVETETASAVFVHILIQGPLKLP